MVTRIDIDLTGVDHGMTERSFLRAAGYSVGDRGRFSQEMRELLDLAKTKGYVFNTGAKSVIVKAKVDQKSLNTAHFKKWCEENGHPVPERRASNELINAYVDANPDRPVREKTSQSRAMKNSERVDLPPLPAVDAKAVKRYADEKGFDYPQRGRLPRWLIESYLLAHDEAGTAPHSVTPNVRETNFGPVADRVHWANAFEGKDLDGSVIRRSFKDVGASSPWSLGWASVLDTWSQVDVDVKIPLHPVG